VDIRKETQLNVKVDARKDTQLNVKVDTRNNTQKDDISHNIIKFGKYDWRVLEIQGGKALLLADKVTHVKMPFNNTCTGVTWKTCSLRKWLNNEFLTQEFTPQEQEQIALTTIQNENNQWYRTEGGEITKDKIFLLSLSEVVTYFGDSGQLKVRPNNSISYIDDNYNKSRIANSISKRSEAWWWLRTPGISNHASFVKYDGLLLVHGYRVDNNNKRGGVRPALVVNL
jgi:hypothetical protein